MSNFPDFRKYKYNEIEINIEITGWETFKKRRYIFDSKTGKILLRAPNGDIGWIPLDIVLSEVSWPVGRSGHWPASIDYFEKITEKEEQLIYNNTIYLEED